MTLNEIIRKIKSRGSKNDLHHFNNETWDIFTTESLRIDDDSVFDDDSFRSMIQQRLDLYHNYLNKELAEQQAKAKIANVKETQKTLTILLSELSNLLNLITVARLFSALSLHALRKQKNINDRVIIAMTEKFTLVQLSSEKISYRHDATQ
jgi:hypothetical protein